MEWRLECAQMGFNGHFRHFHSPWHYWWQTWNNFAYGCGPKLSRNQIRLRPVLWAGNCKQLSAITRQIFLHPTCYSGRLKIVPTAWKHRARCAGADQRSTQPLAPMAATWAGPQSRPKHDEVWEFVAQSFLFQTKPGRFGDKVTGGGGEIFSLEQFLLFPKVLGGKGQTRGTGRLWCHSLLSSNNKEAERSCCLGDLEQTWKGIWDPSLWIPLLQHFADSGTGWGPTWLTRLGWRSLALARFPKPSASVPTSKYQPLGVLLYVLGHAQLWACAKEQKLP